jgi:hypothetical protein
MKYKTEKESGVNVVILILNTNQIGGYEGEKVHLTPPPKKKNVKSSLLSTSRGRNISK